MNSPIIQEFKAFLMRGNVVDLAVAVIMGVAFGAAVTTFVDGIISPIIGAIFGKPSFASVGIDIGDGRLQIGALIDSVINLITVGAAVFFFIVKPIGMLQARAKKEEAAAPPAPAEDVVLLREIRDLLSRR
ncbi:MAG: large conductance mechanosensitive channel protein MscL [Dehalococcoidia bacterium]